MIRSPYLMALIASMLFGVYLPTFLTLLNPVLTNTTDDSTSLWKNFEFYEIVTILCGPGAVLLGFIIFYIVKRRAKPTDDGAELIYEGAMFGAFMWFANVPCYLAYFLLGKYALTKLIILFLVAGGSAGACIGWQAYRTIHENAPVIPQYGLRALIVFTFAIGFLLLVFTR